jgi:biotin-dependent carboxylase-like uncharacterized protein
VRPALRVISPGLNTTVQDRGRTGYQRFGIPVSGALDVVALAAANVVVGNAPGEAALECLYQGPLLEIAAERARLAAAGGAVLEVTEPGGLKTRQVPALESVTLARGARVRVVMTGPGISAYLAAEGGLDVPPVMGSRATYVRAGIGGRDGRALRAGDAVPLAHNEARERDEARLPGVELGLPDRVHVVLGPQDDHFTEAALQEFLQAAYTVTPASDRMGLRLSGPRLEHAKGYNIVSDGIPPGGIQVPGDGQPIVLLADRQTTGGYPKIATVMSADLPALGRVGPGARVRFAAVAVAEAERARRRLEAEIAAWPSRLESVRTGPSLDQDKLAEVNLVSGVVDADASEAAAD